MSKKGISNIELSAAVNDLKYQKKISRDADLIELLGYSKGTISAYLTGKVQPSKAFVKKFEEVFKLSLSTYAQTPRDISMSDELPLGNQKITVQDYISELKVSNEFYKDLIKSNLTQLVSTQQIILAQVKAGLQWDAKVAAAGNKKKEEQALDEINKLVGEQLSGGLQKDNSPVTGS